MTLPGDCSHHWTSTTATVLFVDISRSLSLSLSLSLFLSLSLSLLIHQCIRAIALYVSSLLGNLCRFYICLFTIQHVLLNSKCLLSSSFRYLVSIA